MKSLRIGVLALVGMCFAVALTAAQTAPQKPDVPVEKWTGRTIMLIGAHADDDALSHGTLALLQAHGNQVYVVTLTTGNVGTQDPKLTRLQLGKIRRDEELAALKDLGIPEDHYINLGYDDGMLEFEDRKAVVENLVFWIRKLRPDVLLAWDPGKVYQRWHKADHRAASYLAADAWMIPEYLFYNDYDYGDENLWVDISGFVEQRVNAGSHYTSQNGPGWKNYNPNPTEAEMQAMKDGVRKGIRMRDGKPIEGFRYYRGLPDAIGK
jgi:LmbE family N-acetylglucosaminyl deacetylase